MKILFGTDNFYPNVNGAANFTYALTKGLAESGHDIFVIAPSIKFKNTLTKHEGIIVYGIRSVAIPKIIHPARLRIPLTINPTTIKAIVEEINPDVIHVQDHFMIGSKVVDAGRNLRIPLVGTNHFLPENFIHYFYPPNFVKKPLSKFAWKQFINVYKHLDLITVPTKTAASLLRNIGLKNPIIPISSGVDLDRFNPKNNGDYLKKRYNIASLNPVVLFVGRVDKEKNINVLIKAFPKVLTSSHAKLVIAGKGKERSNLVNLSKKLGIDKNVIFTGFISEKELPDLYRIADLFVIASIAELQSIATLEAMASGLPIIATKAIALPELVYNGKNGYLFNVGDVKTLANQILEIIRNPRLKKKMSENSLKIISHHALNKTIKSYEDIYQRLAKHL